MKDGNTTEDGPNGVNATPDTPHNASQDADLPKGNVDPTWKKFHTVLGQFNTLVVQQANVDVKSATDQLIKVTCMLDPNSRCVQQHGQGWAWDYKEQKCIYVPAQ